jgi:hypothetical protein
MFSRLFGMIFAYPTAPYEMASAWSLVGFALAGCYLTPDYAILTGHTPFHPSRWLWMAWTGGGGLCRVCGVVCWSYRARQLLCTLSLFTWGLIWLTLFWHHGGVAALCLIPPLVVADGLSFMQTGDVASAMRRVTSRMPNLPGGPDSCT